MEFSIIVVGIQYVAIAIMTIIGLYALRQRPSELQKYVVLLMLSTMLMFVGYNIELAASNITEAIAGVGVSYIGKPFIMLTSFLFIARFYNISVDKRLVNFLIALSIAFPLLVTTNNYHHLYYATVNWDPQQDFSHLVLTRGPCYYLYILCAVLFFVVCVYIAILGYKRSQLKHKKAHFGFIVGMVFSGILGYGIYLTGITGGYDATIVGVFVGTIFLALLFTRAKMVDIVTLAKDQALDDSMVGLVVFDTNGKIAYKNSGMKHIIEEGFNIEKLKKIETMSQDGTFDVLPKKEVIELKKEWDKLEKNLGGIKNMTRIPDAIFVVDPKKERICVQEAHSLGITLIGIGDTNCDPEELDYIIPGNDDAIRAVKLIVAKMADAVIEANQGEAVYTAEDAQAEATV